MHNNLPTVHISKSHENAHVFFIVFHQKNRKELADFLEVDINIVQSSIYLTEITPKHEKTLCMSLLPPSKHNKRGSLPDWSNRRSSEMCSPFFCLGTLLVLQTNTVLVERFGLRLWPVKNANVRWNSRYITTSYKKQATLKTNGVI